ncbi:MAG: OmpA family protein [Crocinitomicaceae bacterium]|nr:OmpA family protein [Crocinitomicaceae bacterium]
MRYLLFSLSLVLFASCAVSQGKYSTKNKKAIKYYTAGLQAPNQSIDHTTHLPNFKAGLELMSKALEKDPNFWEAHLVSGEFRESLHQYDKAIEHYEAAIRINPNHSPSGATFFFLSTLQQAVGDYSEAIKNIDIFLNNRRANPQLIATANELRANCVFAQDALNNPLDFNPINIGPGINTNNPEYFPTITVDGKTILFTRLINDPRVDEKIKKQEDFYVSELSDKNIWQQSIPMPNNVNTVNNEGAPTISADGRSLVFVACPDITGRDYGKNRKGRGSCDLFYTKKLGSTWTDPINLPGFVNSANWETQPSLSSDGKTLYFIRGLQGRGRNGDSDIYVAHKDENGVWGKAKKLPNHINTPRKEESVLIHPDGKTLYFASRGHVGMGGSDLFVSRMDKDGNWGTPENLGYPINTKYDENSLMVSPEGEIAFFASNREGGYGDLDIYYFTMPEHLRPTRTLYFDGTVFDSYTKNPLPGKFRLIDLETGNEVIYSEADKINGEFTVSLPTNREYALNVEYPGYTFFSKNFNMTAVEGLESIHMDVPMIPIGSEGITVLDNVFFDLSSARLRKESFVELDKFVQFLSANPQISIELGGHTDTRGDAGKNQVLSENRAKAVYDYVISKGIAKDRLAYKGYGETVPVISDIEIEKLSSEKEKEKAHQTNRRTEYKTVIK